MSMITHVRTGHPGTLLCATVAALLAFAAQASARPDTRAMTCAQAQSLVKRSGAVVLTTGEHTYNRFVSSDYYCGYAEVAKLTWVPTRDESQCPVGYTCRQNVEVEPFQSSN